MTKLTWEQQFLRTEKKGVFNWNKDIKQPYSIQRVFNFYHRTLKKALAEQRKEFEEKGKSLLDKLAEREDLPDTRLIDIGVGMRAIINLIKQK